MIDMNLCLEMKDAIPDIDIQNRVKDNIDQVFTTFLDPRGFFRENVGAEDDCFEGRVVNPGHTLEALWFIMDVATKVLGNASELIEKAGDCILKTLEFGWDKEYGGIFYFLDRLGTKYPETPKKFSYPWKLFFSPPPSETLFSHPKIFP
jgi:N-acylglucosamine 2-epimerase